MRPPIPYLLALFPLVQAQLTTPTTTTPSYCGTTWVSVYSPTYTIEMDLPQETPPLPCPGAYSTQDGACCSGSCISCPSFSFCGPSAGNSSSSSSSSSANPPVGAVQDSGSVARSNCTCPDGVLLYALPLDPCVANNPFYSGCPGNMAEGVCCSGPGIGYSPVSSSGSSSGSSSSTTATATDGELAPETTVLTPVCRYDTALWSVTTLPDGERSTSTYPPGVGYSNTICGTCPLYTRTSTSKGAAGRTAAAPRVTGGLGWGLVEGVVVGAAVLGVV